MARQREFATFPGLHAPSDFDARFPRCSPDKDGLTVSYAIHVDGKGFDPRRPGGPEADPSPVGESQP
jgi:hypothetical protein